MKFLSLLVVACLAVSSTVDAAGVFIQNKEGKPLPGKYIVMLKKNVVSANNFESRINEIMHRNRKDFNAHGRQRKTPKITQRFRNLHGFTIEDGEDDLQELLSLDDVEYIEQDAEFHITATQNNPPSYGLPRISQRNRLTSNRTPYKFPNQAGAGVTAYVLDTGINTAHVDFEGRARMGANFIRGSPNTDQNGHGTHVAGTIGGKTFGVAKKVNLVGIKVLDARGSGATSGIVAGMDFVVRDARGKRAVVNMSLGGGVSRAINDAVDRLVAANIPVFVAAGNDFNVNACNGSPSGARNAFTVAASDSADRIASFSSFGTCNEIIAPGVNIASTWIGSSRATNVISGTSMATPHVAGAAAVYMSVDRNLRTPAQVYNKLIQTATPNKISGPLRGTPNRLLFLS
ncbi:subtilisin-like serine protease [Actinomortierella wolfii]|nr:subtilisin-like serine protease [Actinomortierella wolfii]